MLGEDDTAKVDDTEYCIDLGLIKKTKTGYQIANKIYQEVIPRELTLSAQSTMLSRYTPDWVNSKGKIEPNTLLSMFKDFWNKNSTIWGTNVDGYEEAAPHLVLQAFLQRVTNGDGYINREYALGRNRVDILVEWHYQKENKKCIQNIVIEAKVINKKQSYESVKNEAITQTVKYAKICGESSAYILIFDRYNSQNWMVDEPNENEVYEGIKLEIWKLGAGIFVNHKS